MTYLDNILKIRPVLDNLAVPYVVPFFITIYELLDTIPKFCHLRPNSLDFYPTRPCVSKSYSSESTKNVTTPFIKPSEKPIVLKHCFIFLSKAKVEE